MTWRKRIVNWEVGKEKMFHQNCLPRNVQQRGGGGAAAGGGNCKLINNTGNEEKSQKNRKILVSLFFVCLFFAYAN